MTKALWICSTVLCLLVGLAPVALLGQAVVFKEVKLYSRDSPDAKPNKTEGYLNLDKVGKAVVFVSENRVLLTIPYPWVKNLLYDEKNDHLLTIQYRDSNDQGQFAQVELDGGNRDQILASIEADTAVSVSRVSR